ncbi:MAG TPA: hypothetical protein PLD17_16530, partial [Flavobacteriales bacterium]|nr:hypothetical protein [Flavobacteriales bacterium]
IMNAQEDADEAKYGEQPNREPVLGKESALSAFKEYLNGFDPETGERHIWISAVIWANKEIQAKIDSGELIIVKTVKRSECVVTSSQMEQISLLCCGRVVRNDGDDIKNGEHCRCGAIFIDDAYPSQRSLSICKNCGLCETHIPPIGSHDCPRCSAKITE